MNRKLKIIKQKLLLLSALAVISCSNITKTSDDNSNEASGTEKSVAQESKKNAYIRLSLSNPAERTVLPDITVGSLTDFELTGIKAESTEQIQSEWSTRSAMQSAVLPVSTGHWSFTLTAKKSGTTLSDTTEKNISLGENTLSFNLAVSDKGNGTGSFSITLDFSTAANSSNVNYAVATLENLDGSEVINVDSRSNTENISLVNRIITFNSSNTPVDAGTYRARIKLCAASGAEMASYRDLVQISTGCTSSDTQTIESLDELYTVTYHQNDGSLPSGTTLPLTVTRKSIVNLPTLTRDYYDFGGWYTDENCTAGNEITSITNAQDNIDVYAKFTLTNYTIIYVLNGGTNPTDVTTSYTIENDVLLPVPVFGETGFAGWYENENFSGDILYNWNAGTFHRNIILYAKWDGISANANSIADKIKAMTESGTIRVTGAIDNETIQEINSALKELKSSQSSVLVSLDLSHTTGLTELEDTSYQNSTHSFYNCTNLSEIILPDSVEYIGDNAFRGCAGLTEIVIPDSVSQIGSYTFFGCTGLTEISIPDSVTQIGNYAFRSCTSLTEIIIPDNVTQIGSSVFYGCSNLTEITIPNSVSTIGDSAFSDCTSLTEITIPDSVTQIGYSAFRGCSSLTEITIPDNVTLIGSGAFYGCSSLTEITIPDNVTNIGDEAFSGCVSLTEITIPDNVTNIGVSAFKDCTSITKITIPSSVTQIGNMAFSGCSTLHEVRCNGTLEQWCSINFSSATSTPCYYGADLYLNEQKLTEITIPNSITQIGNNVFSGCTSLTEISISSNVTQIGNNAFRGCASLTEITIPDNVTQIGEYAFRGCTDLTEITIPNKVTQIGTGAFYNCTALTEITIPSNVIRIEDYTFRGCKGLTKITIPSSVTQIGNNAFINCTGLTEITIPDSVTSIGTNILAGCSSLKEITTPFVGSTSKDIDGKLGKFFGKTKYEKSYDANGYYIPESLITITITTGISYHNTHIIPKNTFSQCKRIKKITIGKCITAIYPKAFEGCSNLTYVIVEESSDNNNYWHYSSSIDDPSSAEFPGCLIGTLNATVLTSKYVTKYLYKNDLNM